MRCLVLTCCCGRVVGGLGRVVGLVLLRCCLSGCSRMGLGCGGSVAVLGVGLVGFTVGVRGVRCRVVGAVLLFLSVGR